MNRSLFKKYYLFIIILFINFVVIGSEMQDSSPKPLSFTTDKSEAKYCLFIEFEVTFKGETIKRTHELYLSDTIRENKKFAKLQAFSSGKVISNKLYVAYCTIGDIDTRNIKFLIEYVELDRLDPVNPVKKSEEDKIKPLYEAEFLVTYNMDGTSEYISNDGVISFKFISKWKTLSNPPK